MKNKQFRIFAKKFVSLDALEIEMEIYAGRLLKIEGEP